MNTPISYYGGKQRLASRIIQLFPKHNLYSEPFLGGGAVFWKKEKSNVEVINDTNRELINFYKVVQQDYISLEKEIQISLHSRDLHRKANVIYTNPDMFSERKRAWAVWVLANMSYSSRLNGGWGYDISKPQTSKKIHSKREKFTIDLAIRLQTVQIECTDAIRIITSRDRPDSFFYCDPPYYNSNMGHYDGYTMEDFQLLLETLSKIEGKFLLSSYPSEILQEFSTKNNWQQIGFEQNVSVNQQRKSKPKKKIEMLTANYNIRAIADEKKINYSFSK
jgi:DNA adenine methylase